MTGRTKSTHARSNETRPSGSRGAGSAAPSPSFAIRRRCSRLAPLVSLLLLIAAPSFAGEGDYSVQIGAFREAPGGFADAAKKVGKLYTTTNRQGITRLQVGRYDDLAAARAAMNALRGAGYADAFVVQKNVARAAVPADAPKPIRATTTARQVVRDPLAGVPEELHDRVVMLDGRPHIKEADRFVPLATYLADYQ